MHRVSLPLFVAAITTVLTGVTSPGYAAPAEDAADLLATHCGHCHAGKKPERALVLVPHQPGGPVAALADLPVLERITERIRSRTMPPADAEPTLVDADRERLLAWLDARIDRSVGDDQDPGTVGIRRLTRLEYRNTIRDLLGRYLPDVDVDVSAFPSDDVAYGFDGIAAVNSLSPLLMDRFADAAEWLGGRWAEAVLASGPRVDAAAAVRLGAVRLEDLLGRALRRPPTPPERADAVGFFTRLVSEGFAPEQALAAAAARVLVAPAFLFRIERDGPIGQDRRLEGHELATRLSYFLWSTMPDDELMAIAARGGLDGDDAIRGQVRRLLADVRIRQGLVENFAGQWLQTRRLEAIRPDPRVFPDFDEPLRQAMERETLAFFESLVRDDVPITRLLDADYTFVNERLARHYGLADVEGDAFRRVSLADTPRRGVFGQAAILAINSQSTRTSPVLRGRWILDVLLGTPPPPPPPGTSDLKAVGTGGTLRERMQRHRSAPQCSACHAQMDALGLSLENFDGIGRWRTAEADQPIDATGTLPGGGSFSGPVELAALVRERYAAAFRRSLVEKMLVYAIGRPLGVGDRRTVREILSRLVAGGDRLSSLIEGIALSAPFRLRRNPGRVGVEGIPDGLEAMLDGNPDQQMILTLAKSPKATVPFTGADVGVEVHSLRRLLAAATTSGRRIDLGEPAGGPRENKPWRHSLTLPVDEPVVLTFLEGMIGPGESSDDFLKVVATVPPTDMSQVITIATSSHSWNAPLTGADNVRPGSILSVEFDVTLVAKPRDTIQAWIATPGGINDSMISNSGGFTVEGEGTHRLRQVGVRRPTTHDGWNNEYTVVISTRPQTLVGNLSPIRVVRPRLGVSDSAPIRFARLRPGDPAESDELSITNSQPATIDDHKGVAVASILYGCARMQVDPKFGYKVATAHVGCELVGNHAALFAFVGRHAAEDGRTLSLVGVDGVSGLAGGPDGRAETEPFRVRFLGAAEPGNYTAAVRIVTQAGNLGAPSAGTPGEPMKGLFFLDIPIEASVTATTPDPQR